MAHARAVRSSAPARPRARDERTRLVAHGRRVRSGAGTGRVMCGGRDGGPRAAGGAGRASPRVGARRGSRARRERRPRWARRRGWRGREQPGERRRHDALHRVDDLLHRREAQIGRHDQLTGPLSVRGGKRRARCRGCGHCQQEKRGCSERAAVAGGEGSHTPYVGGSERYLSFSRRRPHRDRPSTGAPAPARRRVRRPFPTPGTRVSLVRRARAASPGPCERRR